MSGPWLLAALAVVVAAVGAVMFGCGAFLRSPSGQFDPVVFGEPGADAQDRAGALVARLTLKEKVAQLENAAPAIRRLGIPAYDWWSESLHGVARNGIATVFPQAIALAATFDEDLLRRVGQAIAREARAKFDEAGARTRGSGRYQGLTFFAPNVNIFRDPRWGRGQETYGEDPFLSARLGVAYVRGLQGDDPRRLQVAAVGKHFAVHSGPELQRHRFDARVDARDLADTYLPQFEALVREGRVSGIMAAYNRLNGEPCVASRRLLAETLREKWGFDGFVVGDCGAVGDITGGHRLTTDDMHGAALALAAGTDLDCGTSYRHLTAAVGAGLVTEAQIDRAVRRLFTVRFRLGLFDTAAPRPGAPDVVGGGGRSEEEAKMTQAHRALAREAAQKSLVLLENDGALPIGEGVRRIAVVGPTADDLDVLLGNYHGQPNSPVTILAGLRAAAQARGIQVDYAQGVTLTGKSASGLPAALAAARAADVVVLALGLSPLLEGEEGDAEGANPAGDRRDLALPGAQAALWGAVLDTGKPTVVVLTGGSAIALPEGPRRPNALLMAWYPGEQGGNAVADVLFGSIAPSGRLPITFYRSVKDLPPFADYGMTGRTYRYFEGKPLYSFGHGLGYAPFAYSAVAVHVAANVPPLVRLEVENPAKVRGDHVVQVYTTQGRREAGDPLRALVGFRRVSLAAGERQAVDIMLAPATFSRVDRAGTRRSVPGPWEVTVGGVTSYLDVPASPAAGIVSDGDASGSVPGAGKKQ